MRGERIRLDTVCAKQSGESSEVLGAGGYFLSLTAVGLGRGAIGDRSEDVGKPHDESSLEREDSFSLAGNIELYSIQDEAEMRLSERPA